MPESGVEKVKNLMLNPHKRVSEAAFDAGFQSLSQFNRVFRRVAGRSAVRLSQACRLFMGRLSSSREMVKLAGDVFVFGRGCLGQMEQSNSHSRFAMARIAT